MDAKRKQIAIAERLQMLLLEDFEAKLKDGTITPTDRATLARLLMSNGWNIDPTLLPKGLQGVLTEKIDPREFTEDDPDLHGGH